MTNKEASNEQKDILENSFQIDDSELPQSVKDKFAKTRDNDCFEELTKDRSKKQ